MKPLPREPPHGKKRGWHRKYYKWALVPPHYRWLCEDSVEQQVRPHCEEKVQLFWLIGRGHWICSQKNGAVCGTGPRKSTSTVAPIKICDCHSCSV